LEAKEGYMPTTQINLIQFLRRAALLPTGATLSDEQLLDSFLDRKDDIAFEMLVRRHGPMVLAVCRRLLPNPDDADDAFQATFLVLVRKAHTVALRGMVGNWLYGVARKAALKARAAAVKRRETEKQVKNMPEPHAEAKDQRWSDLRPILDRELGRLAEKYRAPIVLCDLERKTQKEAARQLGWPQGTLSVRLMRGRKMLAKRLTRCGVSLSAGSLALLFSENTAPASVPISLLASTLKATALLAAGGAVTAGAIGVKAAALTQGVLKAMLLSKTKMVAGVVLAATVLTVGGGLAAYHAASDGFGVSGASAHEQGRTNAHAPLTDEEKLQGRWTVIDGEIDGEKLQVDGAPPGYLTLTISGNRWSFPVEEEEIAAGAVSTFKLNPTRDPKQLIRTTKIGEVTTTETYIYAFDGDNLKICMDHAENSPPATEFAAPKGSERQLLIFKRDRPVAPQKDRVAAKTDQEAIQGEWRIIEGKQDGENLQVTGVPASMMTISFQGDRMKLSAFMMQPEVTINFKLDPANSPRRVTMIMRLHEKEKTIEGIYALEGDTLKLCYGKEPESPLATDFTAPKGSERMMFLLRRIKPDTEKDKAQLQGTWEIVAAELADGEPLANLPAADERRLVEFKDDTVTGSLFDRYYGPLALQVFSLAIDDDLAKGLMNKDRPKAKKPATFQLDATKKPKEISFTHENGITQKAIYQLNGDYLKIGFAGPGEQMAKPAAFGEKGTGVIILRRQVIVIPREIEAANSVSAQNPLRGAWKVVSMERGGKAEKPEDATLLIDGGRACWLTDKREQHGGFYLHLFGNANSYDFVTSEKTFEGIFSLDGETMRLCYDVEPDGIRPQNLRTLPGTNQVLVGLKRLTDVDVGNLKRPDGSRILPSMVDKKLEILPPVADQIGEANKKVFKLGGVLVVGNNQTTTRYILAVTELIPGQDIDRPCLDVVERNLAATGRFVVDSQKGIRPTVALIEREGDGEFRDILVKVQEK
jgi:RNA polymerase sigma factor (sigma-70 family)